MTKNIFLFGLSLLVSVNAVQSMDDERNHEKKEQIILFQKSIQRMEYLKEDNQAALARIFVDNLRQGSQSVPSAVFSNIDFSGSANQHHGLSQQQTNAQRIDEIVVIGSNYRDLTPVLGIVGVEEGDRVLTPVELVVSNISMGVNADILNILNEYMIDPAKWSFLNNFIDHVKDDLTAQMYTMLQEITAPSDELKEEKRLLMAKINEILLKKLSTHQSSAQGNG